MFDLQWPHGLYPARLLCPWDFPDKNTEVGWHFFLQGIFPTQRLNPHLLHLQTESLPLSHQRSPLAINGIIFYAASWVWFLMLGKMHLDSSIFFFLMHVTVCLCIHQLNNIHGISKFWWVQIIFYKHSHTDFCVRFSFFTLVNTQKENWWVIS